MADTILGTVKKLLGIGPADKSYDLDVRIQINSGLFSLFQIGVGTDKPFSIVDGSETWSTFVADDKSEDAILSYLYLKTKLVFDPPTNTTVAEAIKQQLVETEWRIKQQKEMDAAVPVVNPLP